MTTSKKQGHTAGEWQACGLQVDAIDAGQAVCRMVSGTTNPATCFPDLGDARWQEHVTNARLIAAAPDLLAACRAIWRDWGGSINATDPEAEGHATLRLVEAAILKATGEGRIGTRETQGATQ